VHDQAGPALDLGLDLDLPLIGDGLAAPLNVGQQGLWGVGRGQDLAEGAVVGETVPALRDADDGPAGLLDAFPRTLNANTPAESPPSSTETA
jgi:hypothetical protein